MKKMLFFVLMVLLAKPLFSQGDIFLFDPPTTPENRDFHIPLIGDKAPSFTAESTNGKINFPEDFKGKWKILLSHPQDFTPVCTSELLEFAKLQKDFDNMGAQIVVVSTDLLTTHEQWKKSMEGLAYKESQPVKIEFPLVEDKDLVISKEYGMIHPASNTTRDVRGVFIIDPDNVIQAMYFYPMNVGRSTDELVRTLTALEKSKSDNVLTPANWKAGNDVLIKIPPATDPNTSKVPDGYYNLSWYMWFKKAR
jgi:peroxiredoxin 2/4